MALETCADCGERVSPSAKTCPHCGRPIAEIRKRHERTKSLDGLVSVLGILVLLGMVISAASECGSRKPPVAGTAKPEVPVQTASVGDVTTDESAAIAAVQSARVTTTRGHSSMTVKDAVAFYDSAYPNDPHASRTIGWRAESSNPGEIVVSLDYWNAGKRDVARWSYDHKTHSVKAANQLADMLSWVPAE